MCILALLAATVITGSLFGAEYLSIVGSDSMVLFGQRIASLFMAEHNDQVVFVSGGGSRIGITEFLDGNADICETSRDFTRREYERAAEVGIEPFRMPVALDGIAVFVHPDNPVRSLSIEQLRDIYIGHVTNWRDVGGDDRAITLYGREPISGTRMYFERQILNGQDFAAEVQTLPGTASVEHAVAKDHGGIGYGSLVWTEQAGLLAIRADSLTDAIQPNQESVASGLYPLSRTLYWFTDGRPDGTVRELVRYALSATGQGAARQIGYVPLPLDSVQIQLKRLGMTAADSTAAAAK